MSGSDKKSDWIGAGKGQVYSINPEGMSQDAWENAERPEPLYPTHLTQSQVELRDNVDEIMAKLHPRYRELLREYFWERMTLEEMAEERGVTRQAVHQQMQTAIKKFRKEVFRLGG